MKNREVAACWANGDAASGSNLTTDGIHILSYGYYEIGRHVGSDVVFVRDYSEDYSQTTRAHLGLVRAAAAQNLLYTIEVCGVSAMSDYMGQPDWSWISLCRWFDKKRNLDPARPNSYRVKFLPDAHIEVHNRLSNRALRAAKLLDSPLTLHRLVPEQPGYGEILFTQKTEQGYGTKSAVVPLDYLTAAMGDHDLPRQIAAEHSEYPAWWYRLFEAARVPDVRENMRLHRLDRGEPPAPILPFWPKR